MKTVELKAKVRKDLGKQKVKLVRVAGEVPAIVYAGGKPAVAIQMNSKEFDTIIHSQAGENVIITLKVEGEKDHTVQIREIQHHPVSGGIVHVDFMSISLTQKITVQVPVQEKGEPAGVKEGGVLDHVHRTVTVECLPTQIPDRIIVVVDSLNINDAILAKDLVLPKGVVCLLPADEIVLKVLPPRRDEVVAEVVPGEGEKEPEVLTAKKEKEGEEPAAAGKEKAAAPAKEKAPAGGKEKA